VPFLIDIDKEESYIGYCDGMELPAVSLVGDHLA
jgi:hypothetical protein